MQTLQIVSSLKKNISSKITDRIKTFEDACEVLDIDGEILTGKLHDTLAGDAKSIIAYTKLIVIAKALNEGWTPNWSDSSEYKYYPWFKMSSGFELGDVGCNYSLSNVGSRLCFKSEALAQYASKQFLDLYKDYFTI